MLLEARVAGATTLPWGLTPAEREVVARLRAGLTVQQVALERGNSVLTVRTHVKRAKRKVGARNLNELIARTWPTS